MAQSDLYLVLGLSRDASSTAIRSAYRRLAKLHHPDRLGGSRSDRFRRVSEAYSVLSDPERRRRYDATLAPVDGLRGRSERPDEPAREQGVDESWALRDAFESSAGRVGREARGLPRRSVRGGAPGRGRRATVELDLALSSDEAALGGTLRLRVPLPAPCAACRGTGHTRLDVCRACLGDGVFARDTALDLRIPAGVRDGTVWDLGEPELGASLRLYVRVGSRS